MEGGLAVLLPAGAPVPAEGSEITLGWDPSALHLMEGKA